MRFLASLVFVAGVAMILGAALFLTGCNAPPINDDWWRTVNVCDGEGVCKNIIVDNKDELKK